MLSRLVFTSDVNDLILGCGLPGGEQGFNMGHNVAIQLGYDFIPGTSRQN